MNKRKRVAQLKHRKRMKKVKEKRRAERGA
jgi:hypothetical protein